MIIKKRMRGEYKEPEGLFYFPNIISLEEEKNLLNYFEHIEFQQFVLHGQAAKRTVRSYGFKYNFEENRLASTDPLPKEIFWLVQRCAEYGDIDTNEIIQCLISKYPEGSTIGWHIDKLAFGSKVFGVSLLSDCRMQFQRKIADKRYVYEKYLEPRSLYILSKEARYKWQHQIPEVKSLRYSITFRTQKNK